ncbi:hypothetical protein [Nonomuraea sp. NPDC050310]|uniref:hypothetical protein n=1 Tax=Nonomuraea sp. NPDC050310 TaxID=3154935 RepID=UPI0033F345E0
MDDDTEEAVTRGGLSDEEWAALSAEQRLRLMLRVQEALDEETPPPGLSGPASEASRRHPYR